MPDKKQGQKPKATGSRIDAVDMHVSRRLRDRRLALGISLKDLAKELGISYQQIQKYESGANRISSGRLFLFARKLGVEVSHFYEGLADGSGDALSGQLPERQRYRLARDLRRLENPRIQTAMIELVRAIAKSDDSAD